MVASLDEDARVVGEFIRHGGGWGIGFRVAKWVEFSKPGPKIATNDANSKVSCKEFARVAGVSGPGEGAGGRGRIRLAPRLCHQPQRGAGRGLLYRGPVPGAG